MVTDANIRINSFELFLDSGSGYASYIIEEMALMGATLDEIYAFGDAQFGKPKTSLREKICNMYFTDNISDKTEPFESIDHDELRPE